MRHKWIGRLSAFIATSTTCPFVDERWLFSIVYCTIYTYLYCRCTVHCVTVQWFAFNYAFVRCCANTCWNKVYNTTFIECQLLIPNACILFIYRTVIDEIKWNHMQTVQFKKHKTYFSVKFWIIFVTIRLMTKFGCRVCRATYVYYVSEYLKHIALKN